MGEEDRQPSLFEEIPEQPEPVESEEQSMERNQGSEEEEEIIKYGG